MAVLKNIFGLAEAATLFRLAAGGWNLATADGKGKREARAWNVGHMVTIRL